MRLRLSIRQDIVGFDVDWSKFSAEIFNIFRNFFNVLSSLFLCEVIVVINRLLLSIIALARRRSFTLRRYSLSTFSSPSDQKHLLITNCTSPCVTFEINF